MRTQVVQRDGVLYGDGDMTLITLQDGKVVMRDGQVGTEQECCCGGCGECADECVVPPVIDNRKPGARDCDYCTASSPGPSPEFGCEWIGTYIISRRIQTEADVNFLAPLPWLSEKLKEGCALYLHWLFCGEQGEVTGPMNPAGDFDPWLLPGTTPDQITHDCYKRRSTYRVSLLDCDTRTLVDVTDQAVASTGDASACFYVATFPCDYPIFEVSDIGIVEQVGWERGSCCAYTTPANDDGCGSCDASDCQPPPIPPCPNPLP